MSIVEKLSAKIKNKEVTAAIIGLGYVGLPLAKSMCQKGIHTFGLDIDKTKIDMLNAGRSYIDGVDDKDVKSWNEKGLFHPTEDFSVLTEADFIIICVPTPIDEHRAPDLSFVFNTAERIAVHLREGHVVVLESTTYPGTMNDEVRPVLEKNGLTCDTDFYIAYSPERENPGAKDFSTATIPKVVGADNDLTLGLVTDFYALFIDKVVPVSSMATAEATKIMENLFRSVNIALVNELKMIFDKMGLDIWEIIEAAKTKPFGFTPFYPGPGLGGHCIPIDPYYLSWKAKEVGMPTRFIELAGEINSAMPHYVVDKTMRALNTEKKKALGNSKILVLGIAYKKNVADQRETPALPIMDMLVQQGAEIDFYDPHILEILPSRKHHHLSGKQSIRWDKKTLERYDAFIIVTDHDDVAYKDLLACDGVIVDTRNVFKGQGGVVSA